MKSSIKFPLLSIIGALFVASFFTSCKDDVAEQQLPYLFRPINLSYSLNGVVATVSWAKVDSAVSYTVQISKDSLAFTNIVSTVTTTNLSYSIELAGVTRYSARVRANASDTTKNSKFNTTTFKTPAENIFNGYTSFMSQLNTLDIKWLPKANATKLVLKATGLTDQTLTISSAEALAGEKICASLPNATYTVQIYNNDILRGTNTLVVEGTTYLAAGSDLPTALTNATAGDIIVLEPGATFLMGSSTYKLSKDVKVRGLLASNRSTICMTNGTPSTTSVMLGFTDGSILNSVQFENIDFTGYCSNLTTGTKIGYLFNNSTALTIGTLSFKNCQLHNFSNTPMRLQGSKGQTITNLIFTDCTIYDVGFGSTYAIVNSNTNDNFVNISFTGCTIYNFKGSLILRTATAAIPVTMGAITITNCTINQGMQDTGATRFLIDANLTTFTSGVSINNCILGSSSALAAGVRLTTLTTYPTVTKSYYTTDYVDGTLVGTYSYSLIKSGGPTAYSGASTALWNSPTTGDFSFKDAAFAGKGVAGDLRWK